MLEWSAIWRGAVTTAVFAVPVGLLQDWVLGSDPTDGDRAFAYLLVPVIFFFAAAGGYAAAKLATALPLQHGAAAAGLAGLGIQVAGAVRRTIVGDDVSNPLSWILTGLLLATFGMAGGWIQQRTDTTGLSGARSGPDGTGPTRSSS